MMNIFSLLSLGENINLWTNISGCNFWKLSLHVVSESTEFLNVDRLSCLNVVSNILDQSFPDDDVLCFWLKRFQVRCSSLSRVVVLSWIFVSVLKNPMKIKESLGHDLGFD